jgi:hypothetical protein
MISNIEAINRLWDLLHTHHFNEVYYTTSYYYVNLIILPLLSILLLNLYTTLLNSIRVVVLPLLLMAQHI